MEPIEASLANSQALNSNPFEDAATTFVFGNGNTAADNPTATSTQTPSATAATSQGANSPVQASSAPGETIVQAAAASTSSLSLPLILLLAGGAFMAMHFLHHK